MRPGVTRVGALVSSVLAAVLCVLLPAAPVAAHNSLTGSDPRDGARLDTAPEQVRLTFLSRLDPDTTRVTVTGPDGASVTRGEPTFAGSRVTVPVQPVAAGRYRVRYEVASGDGHPVRGEIEFTLTVGATPSVPPTTEPVTPGVATADPSPSDSAEPVVAAAQPIAEKDGVPWWPWVLGAVVAAGALAGGLLWRSRAARRAGPAAQDPAR